MTTPTRDDLVEYATGLIHAARRPGSQVASSTVARVIVNTILDTVRDESDRSPCRIVAFEDGEVELVPTLDDILAAAQTRPESSPATPAPGLSSWERATVARFEAAPDPLATCTCANGSPTLSGVCFFCRLPVES